MTLFFGIILSPIAVIALILSLIKGKVWNKMLSIILFILLPIALYVWFDSGLQLKNSEIFFVEKGYDEYANYTEIEKQEKIIELDLIDKNNKLRMNLSSFIFWIVFITLNTINIKNIKKQKTPVSSSHKRERSY